jgi:hypothetical protein
MLDKLLGGSQKNDLIGMLVSQLGVSNQQAGGFLDSLLGRIGDLLKGGKLDVQKLIAGDTSALKSNLNMEALGGLLGGGADKAEKGLGTIIGPLSTQLGGNKDLLGQLSGLLGGGGGGADDMLKKAAGGLLGGMFGKK